MAGLSRIACLLFVALAVGWPPLGWAGSSPTAFSAEVPPGQRKSFRLSGLPRQAMVSIQVQSDGPLSVALLTQQDFENPAGPRRPLFRGEAAASLTFSATIPEAGDYYLRFENKKDAPPRTVTVTVTGEAGRTDPRRVALERLKASERTLKAFEARLNLALLFKPVPVKIRACPSATSFVRGDTLILCAAYVQRLHTAYSEGQQAADALLFAMYHEMAHVLLTQWAHPQAAREETADELATALMVMFELGAKARSHGETWEAKGSATDEFVQAFPQDPHVLTRPRAAAVRQWADDAGLVSRWQPVLVPHMQTALLERLTQEPQPWTQPELIAQELAVRKRGKVLTF